MLGILSSLVIVLSISLLSSYSEVSSLLLGRIYGFDGNATDVASLELYNQMVRVRVGEIPTGIDLDSNSGLLYVANSGSDYISVINSSSNTVIKNVSLEASVTNIAINPSTKTIYAVGGNAKAVLLVNGVTNEPAGRIPLKDYPDHITIDDKRNIIYVTSAGYVLIINGTDNKILGNIPVGTSPSAIAINSKTNLIYVANNDYSGNPYNTSLIYVMDGITRDIIADIPVALNPYNLDVNEKTNMVYVINEDGNRVSVINGSTNRISNMIVTKGNYSPLGIIVSSIAVNPATNMVYTVNTASDAVNTINASSSKTSVGTISATGGILSDLTINPSNNILYVTDQGANTVYGFGGNTTSISLSGSGNEMVDQERIGKIGITLDESPRDIAVDSKTNNLYIMYENSEEVTEIDGSVDRVLGSFALSGPLVDIVVNPNTHTMYAINETALNVIDIPTNETKVLLMNGSVSALDIDPVANKIFIIGESSDFSSFLYIVDGVTNHVDASLSLDKYMFTEPESLSADPNTNSIYLIDGAGISVIDGVYMEKVDSIPVNTYPFSRIAVNPNTNLLYVANENSRSVYVIDTYSRIIIKTIEVDGYPKSIAVNPTSDTIYVANDVSGTISVIDGTNNTQIGTIRVGVNPISVAVNAETNMVYAANSDSDTISVIDGSIHEVVAGIRFDINPPNSGHIRCDKNEIPINQYQRIKIGAECVAEANSGFQFNSWIEDLGSNSTRTVSLSEVSDSQWNQFWSTLGLGPKDTSANLTVSRFGNFAANFEKLSPPLPDEYLIPLYGIIVSSIVGWSIPSIIGGIKTKRQERKLYSIHKKIDKLYDDGRLDSEDIKPLEDLLSETEDAYAKGKINNERYTNLKTEISVLYEEIFKKKIDSLNPNVVNRKAVLDKTKEDISDAYSKGKITKLHYDLLNEKFSKVT